MRAPSAIAPLSGADVYAASLAAGTRFCSSAAMPIA